MESLLPKIESPFTASTEKIFRIEQIFTMGVSASWGRTPIAPPSP